MRKAVFRLPTRQQTVSFWLSKPQKRTCGYRPHVGHTGAGMPIPAGDIVKRILIV